MVNVTSCVPEFKGFNKVFSLPLCSFLDSALLSASESSP